MQTVLKALIITVVGLCGCKRANPEDAFLGKEHWINTRTDRGTVSYSYDMGSVRRANGKVIVSARKIDDTYFELSENNAKRQAAGLPLYLGTSGTLVFDCRKRTFRSVSTVAEYVGGQHKNLPDKKEQIVEPNTGLEEIFDVLCV